jgi:PPOX class probable F420-dependent enzyme
VFLDVFGYNPTVASTDRLTGHKYLNLETYRRNGVAVTTPVWFAEDRGLIVIYTLANSGKVKRIRNDPRIRVAPSDVRGRPLGDWIDGEARLLSPTEARRADSLLSRKYLIKRIFDWTSRLRRTPRVYLALSLKGPS